MTQIAAGLDPESWLAGAPDPLIRKHGLIGAPVSRVDGPLKVQGKARFAAEVAMDGLTYAALVHSTIACGRIARIGTAAAEAAPGVVLVMTYKNAPRMNPPALVGSSPSAAGPSSLPIMQDASIHWNGEAAAVVLAETQEQADHAASLVEVAYDAEPAVTSFEAAKDRSYSG
jgi:xanthine dehydrogenase YagR molybdenum-binding subunit